MLVIVLLLGMAETLYRRARTAAHTAVWRGREVARTKGCFNCHGFEGYQGIPNPGYENKEVPAWQGGTAMMYLKDTAEIREWVLHGKPPGQQQAAAGLIKMPAFEGRLSSAELEDLVAYLKAVMGIITVTDTLAQQGYNKIVQLGCFGCHGPYGLGGMPNPGSFKGYIPGWDGSDFADLVQNEQELQQWILQGKIDRLQNNRVASRYTQGQLIRMPAYKDHLSAAELRQVLHYIRWVRQHFGK